MFVITKLDIPKNKNIHLLEPYEKQVFFEFDKETNGKGEVVYDYYQLRKDADEDFNIISTASELKYFNDNIKQIKRLRDKSKKKEEEMCKSDMSHLFEEINTPLPNPNHQHCGICRVTFEDFKVHLKSDEHKNHVKL